MPGTISRRGTKHRGGYFVANRSSMESISSLAVKEQANGSVDSLGSSGSGSSGGSAATVDAISLEKEREPYMFYEGPGSHEGDIGHAHAGYDVDDERVYIDDGYDDPSHDGHGDADVYLEDVVGDVDLNDLEDFEAAPGKVWDDNEFETRWSGLVIGDGKDDSPLSPMIYARDDEDVDSDPEDLGGAISASATPRGKGTDSTAVMATTVTEGAVADGFVYVSGSGGNGGGSRTVSRSATVVTVPSRQPSLGRSAQPASSLQVVLPGEVLDDPTDILGDETEMVFASHTSPARRQRGTSYVLGLGGLDDDESDDDEREFVRGKWRRRKPSPEIGAMRVSRASSVGPLRRYQSEESMILGGSADEDDRRGAQTLPAHSVDAPLRLTPNRYVEPEPLMPADFSHRSRLHQGHSSISIPHNINFNPNKPLPPSVFNHEPVFTSGPGALAGVGGIPGQFPYLPTRNLEDSRTQREAEKERDESHSIRSTRSRRSKPDNTKRGLSVPNRDQPKEAGKEHVRKQLDSLAPKQVSYDLWVGRGLASTTPPEKKKGVLTKAQI
ncbi:hypothetical protein L218DRAFT_385596 [Marasmius fiardii PR-910]|nr:hypothetical protein L218DRAFT_385596 [Marasmius fiardii PR-910]